MILIIGDSIADEYEFLETVRPCPEGDWPVVRQVDFWQRSGGAMAVCMMVRTLGEDASTIVNHDCFEPESVKRRIILDGRTLYRIDRDMSDSFSAKVIERINLIEYTPSMVLLADYGKGGVDRSVVLACLDRGWRVIADPHVSTPSSVFEGIWGVTPNRKENDCHNYWQRDVSFPRCCLKQDRDGMLVRDDNLSRRYESMAVQPIMDVCGAGDQVLATIGVMLSRGADWYEACRVANVAAGIKCGKRGATPVTADELMV